MANVRGWPAKAAGRGDPYNTRDITPSRNGLAVDRKLGLGRAAGSALDAHAHEGRHGVERTGRRIVLGMPLGAGSAHVMQLGPVGVEQATGQIVDEVGEIGDAGGIVAGGEPAGLRAVHDPLRNVPVIVLAGRPFVACLRADRPGCSRHNLAKYVKIRYEFASDFSFLRYRCRKVTVSVNI